MSHVCHAHDCTRRVPPSMFACKPHWFALPAKIRAAIWREYDEGQETRKDPSLRYMAVQRLAVAHTAFKPHDEDAAYVAAQCMVEAMAWRQKAIDAGMGDPLAGLVPEQAPAEEKSKPTPPTSAEGKPHDPS